MKSSGVRSKQLGADDGIKGTYGWGAHTTETCVVTVAVPKGRKRRSQSKVTYESKIHSHGAVRTAKDHIVCA